jgi:hypothetical protein
MLIALVVVVVWVWGVATGGSLRIVAGGALEKFSIAREQQSIFRIQLKNLLHIAFTLLLL